MPKYCGYCGKEMLDTAQFCPACGNAVKTNDAPAYNEEVSAPTPAPGVVYNTYNAAPDANDQIASVGRWFWFLLLYSVPVVGFIFLIITACGGFGNKSMTNYARANLIYLLIAVVIGIIIAVIAGAGIFSAVDSMSTTSYY